MSATSKRDCRGDAVHNLAQHGFGRLPVGMSVEIQYDAVPQHRRRDGANVIHAQMETTVHAVLHPPAFHQRLRASWRAPVPDVPVSQLVSSSVLRLRRHHQIDGELLNVRRD